MKAAKLMNKITSNNFLINVYHYWGFVKENGRFPTSSLSCITESSQLEVKYKLLLREILCSKYNYILAIYNNL